MVLGKSLLAAFVLVFQTLYLVMLERLVVVCACSDVLTRFCDCCHHDT